MVVHRRYAFSSDVARALVETHAIAPLKFMPNEDATFGFWVMVCTGSSFLLLLWLLTTLITCCGYSSIIQSGR